jgi:two-component system, NarL family, nitrate/nitrite response regulator NarL
VQSKSILLTSEARLFREGIKKILATDSSTAILDTGSLNGAITMMRSQAIDIGLIVCFPTQKLEEEMMALRSIDTEFPHVPVVILTDKAGMEAFSAFPNAEKLGFLPKGISPDALRMLIDLISRGENIFLTRPARANTQMRPSSLQEPPAFPELRTPLSPRESEVLNCLETGMPNKLIARQLNLAEATVKVHLKSLCRKINVGNRTEAAIWSLNNVAVRADEDSRS